MISHKVVKANSVNRLCKLARSVVICHGTNHNNTKRRVALGRDGFVKSQPLCWSYNPIEAVFNDEGLMIVTSTPNEMMSEPSSYLRLKNHTYSAPKHQLFVRTCVESTEK